MVLMPPRAIAQDMQPPAPQGFNGGPVQFPPPVDMSAYTPPPPQYGYGAYDMSRYDLTNVVPLREAPPPPPKPEGMAGHRLEQLYLTWVSSKGGELRQQLKFDMYYHATTMQWSEEQLKVLKDRKQPPTYFNELRKKIDSYIGVEQRLRRDPKASPATPKHEGDADACTAAVRQIADENNADVLFSEAGRDYFVRGIGALWFGVENKNGKLRVVNRHVPGINFIYDPRSVIWDFSDAKFMGEWGWFDVDDAEEMLTNLGRPESAAKVRQLAAAGGFSNSTGAPGERLRNRIHWFNTELQQVRLVQMYYRYHGQWRCAILHGPIVLYDEVSIYKSEKDDAETVQPYMAVSCNVDITGDRYGTVKDLIPIQDAINQRHAKLLWMLSVRQIICEKGSVPDINNARRQAQMPDGVIELNPRGKDGIDRRFQIETLDTQIEGQVRLLEQAMAMMQNYGPNSAILGKGDGVDNASGRALLARQNAGMTEMQPTFDRHRQLKLRSYKRNWELVRQFWTAETWIRVTDDEKGVHFVGLNQPVQDPQTGEMKLVNEVAKMDVDILLDEGPDTVTMQEELMERLTQLGPTALTPLGKIIITLSGTRNKDMLLKMIDEATKPPPEVEELNKRMAHLESLLKAAQLDKQIADTEKTRADTIASLVGTMATPELLQEFPLQYGAPSFTEQMLGEPLNPHAIGQMSNAFADHGAAKMMIDAANRPDPAPKGQNGAAGGKEGTGASSVPKGAKAPPVPRAAPPQALPPPEAMPQLPGQEPEMGGEGGLPMPPGGPMEPANAFA